jgi:hypothetical protein
MNERTGGSDTRAPRTLDAPLLAFDLASELEALRAEPEYREHGRTSTTLARSGPLRLVLTAVRAGTELGAERPDGPVAVEVLEGRVAADSGARSTGSGDASDGAEAETLSAGSVAWFRGDEAWHLRVDDDGALLLSVVGNDDGLGRPGR